MQLADGRYRTIREIGHGGMATVFEADDTTLDRKVAIKILHSHLQKSEEARKRFTREAKSVARIKSDAIVNLSLIHI